MEILLIVTGVGFAICVRLMIVNPPTAKQRIDMIEFIRDRTSGYADFKILMSDWESVTYEKHMWALFRFEDPMKLYPQRLQTFMQMKWVNDYAVGKVRGP